MSFIEFKKINLLIFFAVATVLGVLFNSARADDVPPEANSETISTPKKWAKFLPYIPEKNEYQAEIGGMWEENNLYWLGLTYGRHLSACRYFNSEKCQQYLDFTGGVGGREGYTEGLALVGLRWQYVSFPNPYSPSFSLFGGLMNIRDNDRDRQVGVYGVNFGYTITLHEKLNVKWENRIGGGDHLWVQSMLSMSLKIDKYVDAFSDKMKKFGKATVDTTGSVLKSTISAPKTLIDWFNTNSDKAAQPEGEVGAPSAGAVAPAAGSAAPPAGGTSTGSN